MTQLSSREILESIESLRQTILEIEQARDEFLQYSAVALDYSWKGFDEFKAELHKNDEALFNAVTSLLSIRKAMSTPR